MRDVVRVREGKVAPHEHVAVDDALEALGVELKLEELSHHLLQQQRQLVRETANRERERVRLVVHAEREVGELGVVRVLVVRVGEKVGEQARHDGVPRRDVQQRREELDVNDRAREEEPVVLLVPQARDLRVAQQLGPDSRLVDLDLVHVQVLGDELVRAGEEELGDRLARLGLLEELLRQALLVVLGAVDLLRLVERKRNVLRQLLRHDRDHGLHRVEQLARLADDLGVPVAEEPLRRDNLITRVRVLHVTTEASDVVAYPAALGEGVADVRDLGHLLERNLGRLRRAQQVHVLEHDHGDVAPVRESIGGKLNVDLEEAEAGDLVRGTSAEEVDPPLLLEVGQERAAALVSDEVREEVERLGALVLVQVGGREGDLERANLANGLDKVDNLRIGISTRQTKGHSRHAARARTGGPGRRRTRPRGR